MGEGLGEVLGLDLEGLRQLEVGVSPEPHIRVDLVSGDRAPRDSREYRELTPGISLVR